MMFLRTCLLTVAFVVTTTADPQPLASPLDLKCRDENSAHECAKAVRDAVRTAGSLDQIIEVSSHWDQRFEREIVKLRAGPIGLQRSKSDMQLIKDAIGDELPDEKDAAIEYAKHAPIPQEWRDVWKRFWSRYLKRISAFLNSAVTKTLGAALKASVPSQVATDYDELLLSNRGVEEAVYQRFRQLNPAPSFVETIRDNAYSRAEATLRPSFPNVKDIRRP